MKLLNYLKILGLDWIDTLLVIFGVFGGLVSVESARLTTSTRSFSLSQPLWVFIIYIVISTLSLVIFMVFKYRRNKVSPIFLAILLLLIICNIIAISINPEVIVLVLKDEEDYLYEVWLTVTNEIKIIHSCSFFFVVSLMYVGVFVLPKQIHNFNLLELVFWLFQITTIVLFIYSLINDNYFKFFSILLGGSEDFVHIKDYIPVSVFGNPNVYAFYLELGIFFSIFYYIIKKKGCLFIISFVYYLLLLFTICKTGILITTCLLFAYLIYLFVMSIINKNKKQVTFLTIVLSILLFVLLLLLIICLTNESIKEKVLLLLLRKDSFSGRDLIWYASLQIISHKVFIGFGYGVFNTLLCEAIGNPLAHNWFLSILGKGGIIYLSIYLLFIGYGVYLLIKLFKSNRPLFISLLLGFLLFFLHSFFEDNYYYLAVIIIYISISFQVTKEKAVIE